MCFFFLFLFKGSSKCGFFPPCCPVQVLSCALCLHHVFLSEQIKMMMMMMMSETGDAIGFRQQLSTTSFEACELEITVNYFSVYT